MGVGLSTFEQEENVAIHRGHESVSSTDSTYSTTGSVGDWVVISSRNASPDHTGELRFNPTNSHAVCAGVGYALNRVLATQNLGESADKDPLRVYSMLRYQVGIPPGNVTTLTSKSSEYPATVPNIIDFLTSAAEKVKEDGLLFFSFSGHGRVREEEDRKSSILITADSYGSDFRNVLAAHNLEHCLQNTKAKYVVIMLDCCHAGMMANTLAEDQIQTKAELYVMAACSKSEVSMCHPELGSGFFTFFTTNHLMSHASRGFLPLSSTLTHAQSLCPAVARLCVRSEREKALKPADLRTVMHPVLRIKLPGVISGEESASLNDVVDGAPRQPSFESDSEISTAFLSLFASEKSEGVFDRIPEAVPNWLIMTAMPSIRALYRHGYLSPTHDEYREVLRMLVCLLARSIAAIFVDVGSGEASDPDMFLAFFTYLHQAIMQAVELEDQEKQGNSPHLQPPKVLCSHIILALHHYAVGLSKSLGCEPGDLRKILELIVTVKNRLMLEDSLASPSPSYAGEESAQLGADLPDSGKPSCSSSEGKITVEDAAASVQEILHRLQLELAGHLPFPGLFDAM